MIHDYEQTISSLIVGGATIVAAVLALFGVLLTVLAYQMSKLKERMNAVEDKFDSAISLINAVGSWFQTSGVDPGHLPRIPANLREHITTWPGMKANVQDSS